MNADAFRNVYDYHFAENHGLWERYIVQLSDDQFTQHIAYSLGSVKKQIVHLINADDTWFCGLRGEAIPEPLSPADFTDRAAIRSHWDAVEARMRAYLTDLHDEMLFAKPLNGEDTDLITWQVLLHVVTHGVDHRAQMLRLLHDFGQKTVL